MSDLVEKVAAAIRPTIWDSKDAARAAIAVVAEWLGEHRFYPEILISEILRKQLR